jgi:hypothetical protein
MKLLVVLVFFLNAQPAFANPWLTLLEGHYSGKIEDCFIQPGFQFKSTVVDLNLKRNSQFGYLEGSLNLNIAPHNYLAEFEYIEQADKPYVFTIKRQEYERRLKAPEDEDGLDFWPGSGDTEPTQIMINKNYDKTQSIIFTFKQNEFLKGKEILCSGTLVKQH